MHTDGTDVFEPRRTRRAQRLSQVSFVLFVRAIIGSDGKPLDERDWRLHKAIRHKTAAGQEAQHASWVGYEFQTLQRLYAAGADVPQPIAAGNNTILMEYIGGPPVGTIGARFSIRAALLCSALLLSPALALLARAPQPGGAALNVSGAELPRVEAL